MTDTQSPNNTVPDNSVPDNTAPGSTAPGNNTHFGYQQVAATDKNQLVRSVFDSVAPSYDLMNDLMSLGLHRFWKRFAIELSGVRRGQHILDVASGTGDLAARFAKLVGPHGRVILSDINADMLTLGRDRLLDLGFSSNLNFIQANAEALPFPHNSFDCITIGFGLRNVTHIDLALKSMFDCLKPGGRLLVLEFSKPTSNWFSKVYDAYSFSVLPTLGGLIAKDKDSYQYLAESIRMHPNQETLKGMISDAGFRRCDYHNLTGGIVAVHRGFKF